MKVKHLNLRLLVLLTWSQQKRRLITNCTDCAFDSLTLGLAAAYTCYNLYTFFAHTIFRSCSQHTRWVSRAGKKSSAFLTTHGTSPGQMVCLV